MKKICYLPEINKRQRLDRCSLIEAVVFLSPFFFFHFTVLCSLYDYLMNRENAILVLMGSELGLFSFQLMRCQRNFSHRYIFLVWESMFFLLFYIRKALEVWWRNHALRIKEWKKELNVWVKREWNLIFGILTRQH